MPTYEYRCENGHTFEVMQRMTDDSLSTCITCEAPVQRVFHPIAVHFKGSGFYNTDYGTRKRAREQKEGGGEGKSESSSGAESKGSEGKSGSEKAGADSGSSTESSKSKPADSAKPGSSKPKENAA